MGSLTRFEFDLAQEAAAWLTSMWQEGATTGAVPCQNDGVSDAPVYPLE